LNEVNRDAFFFSASLPVPVEAVQLLGFTQWMFLQNYLDSSPTVKTGFFYFKHYTHSAIVTKVAPKEYDKFIFQSLMPLNLFTCIESLSYFLN
jgi:hypothetical protein